MKEEKAVAYYEELTRKGEGAARFKQGLGFSGNNNDSAPKRGSALLSSSSSFLSNFVKSSSPTQTSKFKKQVQLEAIQNKLKKKPKDEPFSRVSERSSRESSHGHRSRSRERDRDRDRHHRRRSRSRSREGYRDRRRTSRSRSVSPRRDQRSERRNRSRSLSPGRRRRSEKSRSVDVEREGAGKERNGGIDYSRLMCEGRNFEKCREAQLMLLVIVI